MVSWGLNTGQPSSQPLPDGSLGGTRQEAGQDGGREGAGSHGGADRHAARKVPSEAGGLWGGGKGPGRAGGRASQKRLLGSDPGHTSLRQTPQEERSCEMKASALRLPNGREPQTASRGGRVGVPAPLSPSNWGVGSRSSPPSAAVEGALQREGAGVS